MTAPRTAVLVLALAVAQLAGCALPTTRHQPAVISLPPTGGDLPLRWNGSDFIADVSIDGSRKLPFLFDTGSSLCVVAPSQVAALGLATSSAPRYVRGAGTARWSVVDKGRIGKFVLHGDRGDIVLEGLDFWAIPLPGASAGLFGLTVFGDLLVTLDGPAQRLRLDDGSLPPPDLRDVLPYVLEDGIPVAHVTIGGKHVKVALDSGFDGHVSVPADVAAGLTFTDGGEAVVYHTVHGSWNERLHTLDGDLRIGRHVVPRPPVLVGAGPARIGTKVLRRFVVTFDPRASRVRFTDGPEGSPSVPMGTSPVPGGQPSR